MTWLLLTVVGSSLLGSLHCAGMCGPLAALAAGCAGSRAPAHSITLRVRPAAANLAGYNLGRLLIYCALGAIAGGIGAMIDFGGALIGAQRAAATLAGAIMLVCGLVALLRILGIRVRIPAAVQSLSRLLDRPRQILGHRPSHIRAVAIGVLSGLLPCGWLYAFVLLAASLGDPIRGAATLAAFWIGTLPIMLALGAGAHALLGALRPHMPLVASLTLIIFGMLTVLGRIDVARLAQHIRVETLNPREATAAAAALRDAEMPCCHAEDTAP